MARLPGVSIRPLIRTLFTIACFSVSYWIGRGSSDCYLAEVADSSIFQVNKSPTSFGVARMQPRTDASIASMWFETTMIATISFGKATETNLLQRLLYSLYVNGEWTGRILVLTDRADDYRVKLSQVLPESTLQNVHIMQAREEDLFPINVTATLEAGNGTSIPYAFATESMRYKRFKTLLLEYADRLISDKRLSPYDHMLYLDAEIVVARPMVGLLQDYQDQMTQREVFLDGFATINRTTVAVSTGTTVDANEAYYASQSQIDTKGTVSLPMVGGFMSFFTDCANCIRRQNFNMNGGAFLLHRIHSRSCLEAWRSQWAFRGHLTKYDQRFLVAMKMALREHLSNKRKSGESPSANQQKKKSPQRFCKFWQLPDNHNVYPTHEDMRLKRSATIVHNTNTFNAKQIPLHLQQAYFSYLLNTTAFTSDHIELF